MVSIEQARAQIQTTREQIASAQRGIASRQQALPETRTQRALRAIRGIAGVPAKQRVEAERERLTGQAIEVEQAQVQVREFEQQVSQAEAAQAKTKSAYEKAKQFFSARKRVYSPSALTAAGLGPQAQEFYKEMRGQYEIRQRGIERQLERIGLQETQLKDLERRGFKPIYDNGKLTGFKDVHAQVTVDLPEFAEHMKRFELKRYEPQLFAAPKGFKEVPIPAGIPQFGTTIPEEYRMKTMLIPERRAPPISAYELSKRVVIGAPIALGKFAAAAIPDFPGIKVAEARVEPAKEFVEKPMWVPEFGTAVPEEYRVREYRPTPERRYAPKYIFESKRIKEAVEFGVPLGIGLAAWQAIPTAVIAPATVAVGAIPTVGATVAISKLKEQKIDISEIEKEIGNRPEGVSLSDWTEYKTEYKDEILRYNKEIEDAIKEQRRVQALGIATVGLGAVIGGRQIVRYARQPIIKRLPYKAQEPVWIIPAERVRDPLTGKIIEVGKPRVIQYIPPVKAEKIVRWKKWIGKKPEVIELTKPMVKYTWAVDPIVEGMPGLYYETRVVSPETLTKFKAGKIELFVKPKIVGGPSVPRTLAELRGLSKVEQEMWRKLATQAQYGTPASLEKTPEILKKFQKVAGKTIEFSPLEPLGKKTTRAFTTTITEPVTEITVPTEFGLITRKLPEDFPFDVFRGRTLMKDITKATGMPPRAVGKMPGVKEIIFMKKGIVESPISSKMFGITPAKLKKTPWVKTFPKEMVPLKSVMAPPVSLLKPTLKIITPRVPKAIITSPMVTPVMKVVAKVVPSIWAGKGLYEVTEVGLMSGVTLGVPADVRLKRKELFKIEVDIISAQILKPKLRPVLQPALKPILKPILKLALKPVLKTVLKPIVKPIVRPIIKPIVRPIIKPIVRPILKPVVRPITRPTPSPRPPKPIIPIIPIVLTKPRPKKLAPLVRPKQKLKPGYEVEVKRAGKWIDVTPFAISKGEALALGRRETKAGAEVTFRLIKADGIGGTLNLAPITEAELKEEYRGRIVKGKEVKEPLTFIQKRKARIATPGEFFAITAKGIEKRRARTREKGKIKWLGM